MNNLTAYFPFLKSAIWIILMFSGDELLSAQNGEIVRVETELQKLFPGSKLKTLNTLEGYAAAWELMIPQAVDHLNPNSPLFYQRVYIQHKGLDHSNVLVTEGYKINHRIYEPSRMFDANQITVEYRYCGASVPDVIDWKTLNHEQALKDFYKIQQSLRKIYRKDWIVTGISKGGTTAALYQLQYPKANKAAIAYVAPFVLDQEDARTVRHYRTEAGTADCRQKVFNFQKLVLQKRDSLMMMVDSLGKEENVVFPLGSGKTVEYAALEYPFSFWQWGAHCDEIPVDGAAARDVFLHIEEIVDFNFYDEKTIRDFEPAFYQFMTEFGYYGFDTSGLSHLLMYEKNPSNLSFCPKDITIRYDGTYLRAMQKKATDKAKKILYVYGGLDTWTACGIHPKSNKRSLRVEAPQGGHRTRIKDLPSDQKDLAIRRLKKWTGNKNILTPRS